MDEQTQQERPGGPIGHEQRERPAHLGETAAGEQQSGLAQTAGEHRRTPGMGTSEQARRQYTSETRDAEAGRYPTDT